MTENEKQEAFDKWYDENYDEWAEGEEGIALREELEQAFKSGIAELEAENERLTVSYETLKLHDEEEIGMLKSENAELKEKLKPENCLKSLAKSGLVKFTCENGNEHDQLTKAKEIIKSLLQSLYCWETDVEFDEIDNSRIEQAEQFLKDQEGEPCGQ